MLEKIENIKNVIRHNRIIFQISLRIYKRYITLSNLCRRLLGTVVFYSNLYKYKSRNTSGSFNRYFGWDYRCLTDWYENAGKTTTYFWQDLWAARLIYKNKPRLHYDIGSRIDGLIGHLSAYGQETVLIDIRPLDCNIPNISFICADATTLEGIPDNSVESLSALCSLEHFGLGRYGDDIDPDACFKAMAAIVRVLSSGGHAYISVPIGWEHLEYNAHRIFFPETVIKCFSPLELIEFSCATDKGIEQNTDIHQFDNDKYNRGRLFGLFHFIKT